MSKKKIESEREKDEDEDLDEEQGSEDEGDEEEEEESSAKGHRRARARATAHDDHDDHDDDDHGHGHDDDDEDEDEEADADDPTWWAPHAVLAALVMIGVLGLFGTFNKVLAPLAAKPHGEGTAAQTTVATHADSPRPAQTGAARPMPPQLAGETYGAKHLLVQYKGSMRAPATITRTEDEAKARATEAMKKAKADPSKFAELVKEYSDEPGAAQRGGDLGTFRKGQMVPEFQNAVEKMKVNEVSDLVKTAFGYHVILRTK